MKKTVMLGLAAALFAGAACKKKEATSTSSAGSAAPPAGSDVAKAEPADAVEAPKPAAKPTVTILPADMKWNAFDDKAGIEKSGGFAVLYGDPQNGPNGMLIKL